MDVAFNIHATVIVHQFCVGAVSRPPGDVFLMLSPHSFSCRKHTIGLSLSCLRSALLTMLAVVRGKSTRALVTLCQQEATIQVEQRRMTALTHHFLILLKVPKLSFP